MWNPFKRKEPPETQVPELELPRVYELSPVPGLITPATVLLAAKKWVVHDGKVGIVTAVHNSSYISLDYVGPDGCTVGSSKAPIGMIRLARYLEIPASRRGDQVVAATLGYV